MNDAVKTWAQVTARPVSVAVRAWIDELVDRFGDERVCGGLIFEAQRGPMSRLIERTRDRLAAEDAAQRPADTPREVGRSELMAIVRGQAPVPEGPWIYSTADLTRDEYREVVASSRFGFAKPAAGVAR